MKLQDYEISIPEGKESDGYVSLVHNTQYTLKLMNHGSRLADVEVFIDGHPVGEWRLRTHAEAIIERPVNDTGKFTFYKLGTEESAAAAIHSSDELGLIKVVFKPESRALFAPSEKLDEGGTGLSGHSQQKFSSVSPLRSAPEDHVTIYLRLGAKPIDARPLRPSTTKIPPSLRK